MRMLNPSVRATLLSAGLLAGAIVLPAQTGRVRPKPDRFEAQIVAFEDSDRVKRPATDQILFIGSSIFREWTNVGTQMAPLPVLNRAFGGSRTWELLYYFDRTVAPYRPRVIVYYCGGNDINNDEPADTVTANIRAFVARVHAAWPQTTVVFASVARAPMRRERWPVVDSVNAMIAADAARTPHLRYVDLNPAVERAPGVPRLDLYRADQLHYNPPAYDEFARILKPVVEDLWRER
jgi:lysophospholipase L1-like esterase